MVSAPVSMHVLRLVGYIYIFDNFDGWVVLSSRFYSSGEDPSVD